MYAAWKKLKELILNTNKFLLNQPRFITSSQLRPHKAIGMFRLHRPLEMIKDGLELYVARHHTTHAMSTCCIVTLTSVGHRQR